MRRYACSLGQLLGRCGGNGLPSHIVQQFSLSLARTVAQLHAQGIVLQDLKPDNVLVVDDPLRGGGGGELAALMVVLPDTERVSVCE